MGEVRRLVTFVQKQSVRLARAWCALREMGDVDAIHDFRVACRRLNEPLAAMVGRASGKGAKAGRKLGKLRKLRKLRKQLKTLRRALGEVRDIDVLLASLSAPDSPVKLDARHSAQVEGMLTAERERRYREGVAALEKRKPKRVVRRVQKLAKRYGAGERGAGAAVVEAVRTMWRKRAEALLAAPVLEGEDVRLHPIRVNLKGLRYCTELLLRIGKGEDAALLARFRAMQERLGSWNDHVNAATRLSRLATEPKTIAVQTGWSKAVLEYSAARARAAERLVEEIRERWPTFRAAVEAAVTTYAEVRPEVQSRCGVSARTEA